MLLYSQGHYDLTMNVRIRLWALFFGALLGGFVFPQIAEYRGSNFH